MSKHYAGRSVLHPLSRKATVHVSFSNTRSNSKLHSWASRFSNSLNVERMMISVWGRSRNVSLIDYWKSSACLQPHGHVGMTDGKEMFDGNILCSIVYPYIIVEISRTLRSWCNYLQSAQGGLSQACYRRSLGARLWVPQISLWQVISDSSSHIKKPLPCATAVGMNSDVCKTLFHVLKVNCQVHLLPPFSSWNWIWILC